MKRFNDGFTLVELMVAMAMASIVVAVIYTAYDVQTRIYTEQDRAAEMQQNLRAAMAFMQREARMAGYNPSGGKDNSCDAQTGAPKKVAPGIHTATATSFGFSMDLNEDGDCGDTGENVTYSIYTDIDGIQNLGRAAPTVNQSIAENITNIDLVYLFQPPKQGATTGTNPTHAPTATKLKDVVAVQVALLARSKQMDRKAAVTNSFTVAMPDVYGVSGAGGTIWGPFTDSFKRQLLTATVNCRNMGL